MKTKWMLAGILGCMALTSQAQDEKNAHDEKKGSAIITIFSNLHSGFGSANDDRGFDLDRAYVGYQYKLNGNLTVKAVVDFGQSKSVDDYDRIGYIKNAMATWKYKDLTLNAGLIGTTQFKTQESFWGKRYVMKSFQDEYKFGSSADLGVSASYKLAPWVSADVIVANGEGYKKVQFEDGLQYGAGLTFTPCKGLTLRAYGSLNEGVDAESKDIVNLAAFAGYKHKAFSVAAEYNYMQNAGNVDKHDQSGVSVYASVRLSSCAELFGRWDNLVSKDDWNETKDGNAGIVGAEFKLGKYVKLAPNFRLWSPAADDAKDTYAAYLSASFAI